MGKDWREVIDDCIKGLDEIAAILDQQETPAPEQDQDEGPQGNGQGHPDVPAVRPTKGN